MRAWILLALSVTLSCGGKEEVGGTPVGSCTLGVSQLGANAEQWSCTSSVVDAAGMGPFQQCPANVGAGASCAVNNSGTSPLDGPGSPLDGPMAPGFTSVFTSSTYAPCLQCTSNGLGVVWTCSAQTQWEAGEVFSCSQ
jgi:hypothetical protein